MSKQSQVAVVGLALLLPALILVSTGVLELDRPAGFDGLMHPVVLMGALFLALALNAWSVLRVSLRQDDGTLVGTVSLRVRGAAMNLTALAIGCLLLAVITAYLFGENFQPRPLE